MTPAPALPGRQREPAAAGGADGRGKAEVCGRGGAAAGGRAGGWGGAGAGGGQEGNGENANPPYHPPRPADHSAPAAVAEGQGSGGSPRRSPFGSEEGAPRDGGAQRNVGAEGGGGVAAAGARTTDPWGDADASWDLLRSVTDAISSHLHMHQEVVSGSGSEEDLPRIMQNVKCLQNLHSRLLMEVACRVYAPARDILANLHEFHPDPSEDEVDVHVRSPPQQ